jgi:hypothetical protein
MCTLAVVVVPMGRSQAFQLLPPLVRAKIMEYAEERAAGVYGGTKMQNRRFASKLKLNGPEEWATRMAA